jgi:transcriptional regulator with XRE-family HTH domain
MKTLLIPHGAKKRIAQAAGVSQNTVSAWFTGKHPPTRNRDKAIQAITSVLGVCPDFRDVVESLPAADCNEQSGERAGVAMGGGVGV